MKNKIKVELYGDPDIRTNEIFPWDNDKTVEKKTKKPFVATKSALIKVQYNNKIYYIANDTDYWFDGATIPFGVGKGDMKLQIPALFHDIICENKNKVDYNRYLSSLIFRELLIQCKVNKCRVFVMFHAVDNWQKLQKDWRK